MVSTAPARFGLIGTGWRSEFFARRARQAPDAFQAAGVVSRRPERAAEAGSDWGVPAFGSVAELVQVAAMVAWCPGEGPPPYPLADACVDHQICLAIGESVRTGESATTTTEGWSHAASDGTAV